MTKPAPREIIASGTARLTSLLHDRKPRTERTYSENTPCLGRGFSRMPSAGIEEARNNAPASAIVSLNA